MLLKSFRTNKEEQYQLNKEEFINLLNTRLNKGTEQEVHNF